MKSTLSQPDSLRDFFSFISQESALLDHLVSKSKVLNLPEKTKIACPGDDCDHYILVLSGRLRIQLVTESGKEVVLYYVNTKEDCVLTTSCLLGGDSFPAEVLTESDTSAIVIPAAEFHQTLVGFDVFRQFIFSNFAKRLADVFVCIEEIYSYTIEEKLAKALLEKKQIQAQDLIHITHADLASHIGSSREVVSRQLKKMEGDGFILLGRGTIQITNQQALEKVLKKNT